MSARRWGCVSVACLVLTACQGRSYSTGSALASLDGRGKISVFEMLRYESDVHALDVRCHESEQEVAQLVFLMVGALKQKGVPTTNLSFMDDALGVMRAVPEGANQNCAAALDLVMQGIRVGAGAS